MNDSISNPTPPVDQATENWFDSIQTAPPEPPKNSRKKHLLIGLGILVLLAAAGTVTALIANERTACLNAADYKTLTGTELNDAFEPSDSFYTTYVLFKPNSNNYDNSTDSGEHGLQLIQKIADFYKITANKSVIITVSSNYFTTNAQTEAKEHVQKVKSSLVLAGISESSLEVTSPTYIDPEDVAAMTSETTISVTSASTCK